MPIRPNAWHTTTGAGPASRSPSSPGRGCCTSSVLSDWVWITTAVTGCLPLSTPAALRQRAARAHCK